MIVGNNLDSMQKAYLAEVRYLGITGMPNTEKEITQCNP